MAQMCFTADRFTASAGAVRNRVRDAALAATLVLLTAMTFSGLPTATIRIHPPLLSYHLVRTGLRRIGA
jgi:hypothetical protein